MGGARDQRVYSVGGLPAGGAVVTGGTGSNDRTEGDNDILMARVGPDGDLIWRRELGGDRYDVGHGVASVGPESPLSSVITAYGTPSGNADDDADAMLVRLDGHGDVVWQRVPPAAGEDRAMMSARTAEGWVTVGYRVADRRALLLLHGADPEGGSRWRRSFDAPGTGRGVMVRPLAEGGLAVVGAFGGPRGEPDGLRVLRLDARRQDPAPAPGRHP